MPDTPVEIRFSDLDPECRADPVSVSLSFVLVSSRACSLMVWRGRGVPEGGIITNIKNLYWSPLVTKDPPFLVFLVRL